MKGWFLLILPAVGLAALLACWYRRLARRKADREQMRRKAREDALDRAISNPIEGGAQQAQSPVEVMYREDRPVPDGPVLRLTEMGPDAARVYLFPYGAVLYLGERDGRAAVLQREDARYRIECAIFGRGGAFYACAVRQQRVRLRRRRRFTLLDASGVRLNHLDRLELSGSQYKVELLKRE